MKILYLHQIVILVEDPQKNDNGEVGLLPTDDESCASTVLCEENRPASPSMISNHVENIPIDRDEMIVDSGKSVLIIMHPPFNP